MNNNKIITNIIGTHGFFWRSMAIEIYEKNGLFAWSLNSGNKYLNGATNSNEKVTREGIQEVIEFFKVRKLPWLWNLNPIYNPGTIEELLITQGLKPAGSGSVMYYELNRALPEFTLNNYNIREITNDDGLSDWNYLQEEGFGLPSKEFHQATKKVPYGKTHSFHHYVSYLGEKPVSCATLSISKYGARIDNIATCNDFLRQGLGMAITLFAMNEAKKNDCKIVCLESSTQGLPLYLKLGFKEIYLNKEYEIIND